MLSIRQIAALSCLSIVYLAFELAFNARLLDVVGSSVDSDQIHAIEHYGRVLSGVALSLFVLQFHLKRRSSFVRIVVWCALSGTLMYFSIQLFVDFVVAARSAEFRRESLNISLVQGALVGGRARLAGLDDDPAVFSKPEGKAFLAVFPGLAANASGLEERLSGAKTTLVREGVSRSFGPSELHAKWLTLRKEVQSKWERYSRLGTTDTESQIVRQEDDAWNRYLGTLGKRGWTPSTIPPHARGAVVRKVRNDLPSLPVDWEPSDETAFRSAVAQKARQKLRSAGDGSVTVSGKRIPPGLGFEAFFLHAGVQTEIRKRMDLPSYVTVQPNYQKGDVFEQSLYEPWLKRRVQSVLLEYSAPLDSFEPGGHLESAGEKAARAVLVPPIALFFSLLGAIAHSAKLCYLSLQLVARLAYRPKAPPKWLLRSLLVSTGVLFLIAFSVLLNLENAITQSRVYTYLVDEARSFSGSKGVYVRFKTEAVLKGMHVVAVGQGYGYPLNERVRRDLLGGIDFGYHDAK